MYANAFSLEAILKFSALKNVSIMSFSNQSGGLDYMRRAVKSYFLNFFFHLLPPPRCF